MLRRRPRSSSPTSFHALMQPRRSSVGRGLNCMSPTAIRSTRESLIAGVLQCWQVTAKCTTSTTNYHPRRERDEETKIGGQNELLDPSALIKGCHRIPSVALKVYLVPKYPKAIPPSPPGVISQCIVVVVFIIVRESGCRSTRSGANRCGNCRHLVIEAECIYC